MKLYYWPMSHNARKVRALWRFLGRDDVDEVQLSMTEREHKTPAFLTINPNGQIPALETDDGPIWGANACLLRLGAGHEVWPDAAHAQAEVVQWMHWQASALSVLVGPLHVENYFKRARGFEVDAARVETLKESLRAALVILDAHLATRQWLVGAQCTLADFAVGGDFSHAIPAGFPLNETPHLRAWLDALSSTPGWQETAPPVLG